MLIGLRLLVLISVQNEYSDMWCVDAMQLFGTFDTPIVKCTFGSIWSDSNQTTVWANGQEVYGWQQYNNPNVITQCRVEDGKDTIKQLSLKVCDGSDSDNESMPPCHWCSSSLL